MPRSVADHSFGYADALREGVVRPVLFMAYWSDLRWRTRMGAEVTARLGEPLTRDLAAQALRTAPRRQRRSAGRSGTPPCTRRDARRGARSGTRTAHRDRPARISG